MDLHELSVAYVSGVTERLKEDGFIIDYDIKYKTENFLCVAHRRRYQLEYFGFIGFSYVFSEFKELSVKSLWNYSAKCFEYAKRFRRLPIPFIPIPYVPQDTVACFPVALVLQIDDATAEILRYKDPPRHWFSYNIPAVYEFTTNKLHISETKPLKGSMWLGHFKEMIQTNLVVDRRSE